MRVPTLQSSRQNADAISARQAAQSRLQAQVSSGLRVDSPGDDPVAAAQAEQARARLSRIAQDQRAAALSQGVLAAADTALAGGIGTLQAAREALVAAGNGSYTAADRAALALQLRGARDALLQVANTRDAAGGFVFAGQGSAGQPLTAGAAPGYAAAAGTQRTGSDGAYATTLDGRAAFLAVPGGNGVFETSAAAANTGTGWIGAGSVGDVTRLTGHAYDVAITGTAAAPRVTVTDTVTGLPVADVPYQADTDVGVDGQVFRIGGTPAPGDRFTLAPSQPRSVFRLLDDAAAALEDPALAAGARAQALERAHAGLDQALDRLSQLRTGTAEELRRADDGAAAAVTSDIATRARQSDLRELDMARGISELQQGQASLDAALRTYASIGRTSLFELLR